MALIGLPPYRIPQDLIYAWVAEATFNASGVFSHGTAVDMKLAATWIDLSFKVSANGKQIAPTDFNMVNNVTTKYDVTGSITEVNTADGNNPILGEIAGNVNYIWFKFGYQGANETTPFVVTGYMRVADWDGGGLHEGDNNGTLNMDSCGVYPWWGRGTPPTDYA